MNPKLKNALVQQSAEIDQHSALIWERLLKQMKEHPETIRLAIVQVLKESEEAACQHDDEEHLNVDGLADYLRRDLLHLGMERISDRFVEWIEAGEIAEPELCDDEEIGWERG